MTDEQSHFIPASPGYWALEALRPSGARTDYEVMRIPIIGWEMRSEAGEVGARAVPISIYDVGCPDGFPILGPDGGVRCDGRVAFESEREWLEDVKARDRAAATIDTDQYFRRKPINVCDEDGVFTCDTEPWATVEEFEKACALIDAFQQKTRHRGAWTIPGYFEMLVWGETKEAHRAIARDLLNSSKRGVH